MARSIDDWFAHAWASEPDPGYDRNSDDLDSWLNDLSGRPARTPAAPPQLATTSAGAGALPRRPVGATRFPAPAPPPGQSSDGSVRREIQAAIQRIRCQDPGIGARKLARRLRDRGWPAIAVGEVRALLAQIPAPRSDNHPSMRPRMDQTVGVRHWPVLQRALICRGCGSAVSLRGTCRCP